MRAAEARVVAAGQRRLRGEDRERVAVAREGEVLADELLDDERLDGRVPGLGRVRAGVDGVEDLLAQPAGGRPRARGARRGAGRRRRDCARMRPRTPRWSSDSCSADRSSSMDADSGGGAANDDCSSTAAIAFKFGAACGSMKRVEELSKSAVSEADEQLLQWLRQHWQAQ